MLGIALVATPAAAQVGVFGTWVRYGDADYYLPVTKKASLAVNVNVADAASGNVRDNCVILDTAALFDNTVGAGAHGNDIRLSTCSGKAPGTFVGGTDPERTMTFTPTTIKTVYGDANGNSKFDKGEPAFITTASSNMVPSTNATTFTIRLTTWNGLTAGTYVFSGDEDFRLFGASALSQTFGVVEREDKAIYLVPGSVGSLLAKSMVPEKSIRILSVIPDQPDVKPVSLEVLSPEIKVGERIKVKVTMENLGKIAGWGIAAVKLDGIVLDVEPTIVLSPGDRTSVTLTSLVPPVAEHAKLEAGNVMEFVDVVQLEGTEDAQAATIADLVERINALEGKIAALEAAADETEQVRALEVSARPGGNSPSLNLPSLLVIAGLALFMMRRRNA